MDVICRMINALYYFGYSIGSALARRLSKTAFFAAAIPMAVMVLVVHGANGEPAAATLFLSFLPFLLIATLQGKSVGELIAMLWNDDKHKPQAVSFACGLFLYATSLLALPAYIDTTKIDLVAVDLIKASVTINTLALLFGLVGAMVFGLFGLPIVLGVAGWFQKHVQRGRELYHEKTENA